MDGDDGSGGGGQEDLVGAGAAETSESTRETLDAMGYAVTGDGEGADASAGSSTHIVIKVFAVVLVGLLLALFVLGSGVV